MIWIIGFMILMTGLGFAPAWFILCAVGYALMKWDDKNEKENQTD